MGVSLNWITDSIACQVPIVSPDRPALAFEDQPPISYRELREAEMRYATALRDAGVAKGDRVAILMRNSIEYAKLFFAVSRVGAISVRLNWRLTGPELKFLLDDSGTTFLFLDAEFVERLEPHRAEVPVEKYVVVTADEASVPEWATSLESFGAVESSEDFPVLGLEDAATIMYTSGTTGLPKGAVLTHGNLLWLGSIQESMFHLDSDSVAQTPGPMFHAAAIEICILPALLMHGMGVLMGSGNFSMERYFEIGRAHNATLEFAYSHMLYELFRREDLTDIVPKSLKRIMAGGDVVMPWVYDEAERRLPGVEIDQTYGLTEGGMVCALLPHKIARGHETSVGRPNPLCELKLLDEAGELVGPGEVGEVYTRNPGVSPGYWNRPEANAATFVDGWCRTGDLATFDEDGYMSIVGRAKDMIRSGGENIYPAELEKVLTSHDAIGDAAVVGVPDAKYVEVGAAILVPADGKQIDVDEIRAFCIAQLAKFKIPKHFVVVDELPRNSTGKVLKNALREQYVALGESATSK